MRYQISIEDIFYIDSVDGKTFLYDREQTYHSRQILAALEELLRYTTFVRISKSCLLNVSQLKCVQPYANHRMKNGTNIEDLSAVRVNHIYSGDLVHFSNRSAGGICHAEQLVDPAADGVYSDR